MLNSVQKQGRFWQKRLVPKICGSANQKYCVKNVQNAEIKEKRCLFCLLILKVCPNNIPSPCPQLGMTREYAQVYLKGDLGEKNSGASASFPLPTCVGIFTSWRKVAGWTPPLEGWSGESRTGKKISTRCLAPRTQKKKPRNGHFWPVLEVRKTASASGN